MKHEIIDNVLSAINCQQIKGGMLGADFGWRFNEHISDKTDSENFYFTHLFSGNLQIKSNFFQFILPLLEVLKVKALIRVKGNLYTRTEKREVHPSHVDYDFKHKGAIFYVNTNNGLTILKDDTEIKSVENRLLLFDASEPHRSTSCTDEKYRMNININYF